MRPEGSIGSAWIWAGKQWKDLKNHFFPGRWVRDRRWGSHPCSKHPDSVPLFQIGYFPPFSLLQDVIMVQLGRALLKKYRNVRVVIRMSLGGCTNRPFYRIVAAHNRRARDGKYLQQIGCYDPLPNHHGERIVGINFEQFKHWFANGATLTKPVEKLLGLSGFLPLHPMTVTDAERLRKKKAREAAKVAENEEGEKEESDEKQEQQQN
ncbi:small ribosomal subunit protein bS16m [Erythrolamprus reginae]|uniref:small ribosomal subunit protein bS16m n=1 Tax=Erythrolamprus reginae TaxID=121349 RepID=UPI00396CC608